MTYRGAPNWETWAVHAWISAQEDAYFHWRERAYQTFLACETRNVDQQSADAQRKLAAELRYYFTDPSGIVGGRSAYAQDVSEQDLQIVVWEHVADNILSGINYDDIEYVCDGGRKNLRKPKDGSGRRRKLLFFF